MKNQSSIADRKIVRSIARALSWGALFALTSFLLLAYNAAYYWYTPLTGVEWDYTDNTFTAIQISRVVPGSPGAAGGLQVGDGQAAAGFPLVFRRQMLDNIAILLPPGDEK